MAICGVCCETLNQSNHKQCVCPKCNFISCKTCIRTYLGSTPNESHCMNCKFEWSDAFVVVAVNKTYFHTELREQKKQKCFEIEKSKLAESQMEAKHFLVREHATNEIKRIDLEMKALKKKIEELKNIKSNYVYELTKKIKKEQKAFIMKCQASDCNGFVSKSYKCELCDKTTCSKCFVVSEENHECKPEDIETAEYIKSNSKPCPKCATRISKIDGCSQMWCTQCQTPFDWTTGQQLINVNIHNPHYFQYLQHTNGGVMPRNPNDILCGGMPDLSRFRAYCNQLLVNDNYVLLNRFISSNVYNIYRYIGHIQGLLRNHILREFERNIEETRIKLILNRITEEKFKEDIYRHYSKKNKQVINNRLLETVHVVGVDLIQRYCNLYNSQITPNIAYESTYNLLREFSKIIEYFNELQEEKTKLFKEKGIRIHISNIGKSELSYTEIPNITPDFIILNYNMTGHI